MKKTSRINKIVLIVALLLFGLSIAISTYAVYKSSAKGTSELKTAAWSIKLNGDNINTSNTFDFDLTQFEWTHDTIIDSSSTSAVIAPGSVGTYGLEIDTTGTEVDVWYSISIVVKQNDTEIDLATINPNLSIGVYKNDILKSNPLKGTISAGSKENLELKMIWNYIDNEEANIQDIDINNQDFVIEVTVITKQQPLQMPVCKAVSDATTLHTATCSRGDMYGCNATGQAGNGNTITYGTVISGSPKPGDAFDCDVNNDGEYDPVNERFYYLTSYGDTSVLLYSKDMNDGTTYAYDSEWQNYNGPRNAYQYLPSTDDWDNPRLIAPEENRQILAENGSNTVGGGSITIATFTYTGRAARLLTSQDLFAACPSLTSLGSYARGELDNCIFLMENIGRYEGTSGTYGYWLETPRASSSYRIWNIYGVERYVYTADCNFTDKYTVRPVITVLNSDIE